MTDFVTEDRQCQVADMTFVAAPSRLDRSPSMPQPLPSLREDALALYQGPTLIGP